MRRKAKLYEKIDHRFEDRYDKVAWRRRKKDKIAYRRRNKRLTAQAQVAEANERERYAAEMAAFKQRERYTLIKRGPGS